MPRLARPSSCQGMKKPRDAIRCGLLPRSRKALCGRRSWGSWGLELMEWQVIGVCHLAPRLVCARCRTLRTARYSKHRESYGRVEANE